MSTYDFSIRYTTLAHNLIKDKFIDLIETTLQREGSSYLACNNRMHFFYFGTNLKYHAWSCQNMRDFMMSLSDDKQADVINAFNTTSRYLDAILNINNVYFDNMVSQIYLSELQLNKANSSDNEATFLDMYLSIFNDIFSTKFIINVTTLILKFVASVL